MKETSTSYLNLMGSEDFKGIISFMFSRADVDYPNKISICKANMPKTGSS